MSLKKKTEILKLQFVSVDAEFLKNQYVLALILIVIFNISIALFIMKDQNRFTFLYK